MFCFVFSVKDYTNKILFKLTCGYVSMVCHPLGHKGFRGHFLADLPGTALMFSNTGQFAQSNR